MTPSTQQARQVAEQLLDTTGVSLLSGDFATFAACFGLPHLIDTFDGQVVLHTLDDMRERFDNIRVYLRQNAATDLVRHVIEAAAVNDNTIHSSHQSRILSGTALVQAPYPAMSVLKRSDAKWVSVSSQYAIADAPDQNNALSGKRITLPNGETHD